MCYIHISFQKVGFIHLVSCQDFSSLRSKVWKLALYITVDAFLKANTCLTSNTQQDLIESSEITSQTLWCKLFCFPSLSASNQ